METLDVGSLSDEDLDRSIDELAREEAAISAERRLLHEYLGLLGIDRQVQASGVPLDGWAEKLVTRENAMSYERTLLQGRLDILQAEKSERQHGGSLAPVRADALTRALSRQGRRSATRPSSPPSRP